MAVEASHIISKLHELSARDDRFVELIEIPGAAGVAGEWPQWLTPAVRATFNAVGITQPWAHQVQALTAIHSGRHAIITTATGSGKSVAAWAWFLNRLAEAATPGAGRPATLASLGRRPTALYLSPTKALAADQADNLRRWAGVNEFEMRVGTADGDTPRDAKLWAANSADIVLSNPDFVHFALLRNHPRWARFLRNLELVVVDELHFFRGLAAAHVALVVRRVLRLARRFGANPRVVILSATTTAPGATAARFIGCGEDEICAVTESTAPRGSRQVVIWQPGLVSPDFGAAVGGVATTPPAVGEVPVWEVDYPHEQRHSPVTETGALLAALVREGARTLAFVRSRPGTEAVAALARESLDRHAPDLAARVAAYRGGYLPHERRELEAQLRSGQLLGVASTSALEVGIDVAGLDVTITCGWPGTRASFLQQIGRAGRAGGSAVAILVVGENPLDAYFRSHPDAVFAAVEATVFDPYNPYVLGPHLCCAAAEAPLNTSDSTYFGENLDWVVEQLTATGLLRPRPGGWYWDVTRGEDPYQLVDIRGGGTEVQIMEGATGSIIGSVAASEAEATVHPGAIYVHQGQVFEVLELTEDVAVVTPGPPQLRTRPWVETDITITNTQISSDLGPFTWNFGDVEVLSRVRSYDLLRLPGLQFVGEHSLDLPQRSFVTQAVWFTIDPAIFATLNIAEDAIPGALHAAEHALIGILPLLATCDRWDLGGLSTQFHPATGTATVFIHDAIAGGSGFSQYGHDHPHPWVQATLETISACDCAGGCPACVMSPKCGNNNSPLSKAGARHVLSALSPYLR